MLWKVFAVTSQDDPESSKEMMPDNAGKLQCGEHRHDRPEQQPALEHRLPSSVGEGA